MNCDICHRSHHPQKLPFLCAVDARNRLYEGRVAQATALLANETLEQDINGILSRSAASPRPDGPTRAVRIDTIKSEETQAADRTSQIIAQADKLRVEVEAARAEIEERKKKVARRKADIAEASSGINARRTRLLEETKRSIQMTRYRWNQCFENTTATRGFLCMEAARVYGLRRIKRSNKYELGGVEMVDLPGMIHASPELITNSLAHIAHILMLASHYLAIRLPAEITLPHSDYPRPTIFTLSHSYRHGEVVFPGAVALPPTTQSGHSTKHVSRPRPLFIDKPLSVLAKEDPSTYSLFVEGVILLAYDIAWACCTQGVPIGDKSSYEDVYNMGRNLYNLLIGNQLINNPALRLAQTPDETEPPEMFPNQLGGNMMGRWSHGTTHTFLGSAEGNEFIKGFQLPSPVKLADRLKKKMLSDADGLDWEMLEDEAWAPDEPMEEGVQDKHNRAGRSEQRLFGVESVLSTVTTKTMADSTRWEASRLDLDQPPSPENAKSSGTSGWTKIKSR